MRTLPGDRDSDRFAGLRAERCEVSAGTRRCAWRAAALPAAEPLITALRDPHVQSSVTSLGGYDLSRAGAVHLLR
jgi:hypothetical protein